MKARRVLAAVAATAAVLALGVDVSPTEKSLAAQAAPAIECAGRAFPWDSRCWGRLDGRAFARWLARHGSSPARFKRNHPELAAVFRRPWPPPPPYWRRCETGYACALAVLPHYFTNWRYALGIVRCETGGTYSAYAHGSAGERGWFQIHPVHGWAFAGGNLYDVRYNSAVARRLSSGGRDWAPWTCAY